MKDFQRELQTIKKKILNLGVLVEKNVYSAVKSVLTRDGALAEVVVRSDSAVDQLEVDIEEDCLEILALHQPVARDLRFIVAVLKLNNDLERIGDLASNIAWRGEALAKLPPLSSTFDLNPMTDRTKSMVRKSLEALVQSDVKLAREVLESDDSVDSLNKRFHEEIQRRMRDNPDEVERLVSWLSVVKALERIADHTTNIAEDVIYMVEGDIIRHGRDKRLEVLAGGQKDS
ncbi:MAG: phosphate signaling complex protein PhoU [Bdellovibrionota bacterium]|nr:MAG: phosphate signaling complex protein PhoU [Bdellovibrionota bacterium]